MDSEEKLKQSCTLGQHSLSLHYGEKPLMITKNKGTKISQKVTKQRYANADTIKLNVKLKK